MKTGQTKNKIKMDILSEEEKNKIYQIVALGMLIPEVKIGLNLDVKNVTVYDFPKNKENHHTNYLYHFDAWFHGNIDKLDQCIKSLTDYVTENGFLK